MTPVSRYQNVFTLNFTGAKDDGGGGDNLVGRAKLQSNRHHQQTPNFLQATCPSFRPNKNVRALKGNSITFHGLAHPQLIFKKVDHSREGCQVSRQPSVARFWEYTPHFKKVDHFYYHDNFGKSGPIFQSVKKLEWFSWFLMKMVFFKETA